MPVKTPAVSTKARALMDVRLPVRPEVFLQLTDLLNDPRKANRELEKVIRRDPVLTAQVLRVSNSAYYGSPRNIASIDQAVLRIGLNEVASIAAALKARQLFEMTGGSWTPFHAAQWEHALKTAVLARILGRRLNAQTAELFFTAGLLHDFGKLLLQRVYPDYAELSASGAVHGYELLACEVRNFGMNHASLGAELLRHWKLPNPIGNLVEKHHDEMKAGTGTVRAQACFVLANELAHHLGAEDEDIEVRLNALRIDNRLGMAGLDVSTALMLIRGSQDEVYRLLAV